MPRSSAGCKSDEVNTGLRSSDKVNTGIKKDEENDLFDAWNIETLTQENIEEFVKHDEVYFIDPCEHVLLDYLDRTHTIEMNFSEETLRLSWKGKSLDIGIEDL